MTRTIINIGVHEPTLLTRAAALERAGYRVRTALSLMELERYLSEKECDALLVGQALTPAEKRRALIHIKQWESSCPVIELYVHSPELPEADYHVPIDDGLEGLLKTVEQLKK